MAKTDITFADFWTAYNLKRDRQRAERAWNRLSARDRRSAYQGIEAYQSRCRIEGISIMYAQGYLNNRRWEDEPLPSPAPPQEQPTPPSSASPYHGEESLTEPEMLIC